MGQRRFPRVMPPATQHKPTAKGSLFPAKGSAVPDDLHAEIVSLIATEGEGAARARTGLSRTAFARVVAKLPVYPGTLALARESLRKQPAGAEPAR